MYSNFGGTMTYAKLLLNLTSWCHQGRTM